MRLYVDQRGGCYDQREVDKLIAAKDAEIAMLRRDIDSYRAELKVTEEGWDNEVAALKKSVEYITSYAADRDSLKAEVERLRQELQSITDAYDNYVMEANERD